MDNEEKATVKKPLLKLAYFIVKIYKPKLHWLVTFYNEISQFQ